MSCYVCHKPKTQSEMYFNGSEYLKICNECVTADRVARIATKKVKRAEFRKRFNDAMAVV